MFFQILSLIKGTEGTLLKMECRRDGKDFEVELVRRVVSYDASGHADGPQQPSILMKSEDSGSAGCLRLVYGLAPIYNTRVTSRDSVPLQPTR